MPSPTHAMTRQFALASARSRPSCPTAARNGQPSLHDGEPLHHVALIVVFKTWKEDLSALQLQEHLVRPIIDIEEPAVKGFEP